MLPKCVDDFTEMYGRRFPKSVVGQLRNAWSAWGEIRVRCSVKTEMAVQFGLKPAIWRHEALQVGIPVFPGPDTGGIRDGKFLEPVWHSHRHTDIQHIPVARDIRGERR